jgi:hypothetical protein
VRDALDLATDGAFTAATARRSHGYTWRGLALAQMGDVWWMYLAVHAGLGQTADETVSIRDETYLPALLMEAARKVELVDGAGLRRPLVSDERIWSAAHVMAPARTQAPDTWFWFLLASVLWAGGLLLLPRKPSVWAAWSSALFLGLGGAACAFFWFFTAHWAAGNNQNLVLFNPLYLLLCAFWLIPMTRRVVLPLSFGLMIIGVLGSFAKVLPAFSQQNIEWVILLLPVQWAIWRVVFRNAQPRAIALTKRSVA